jgi:nucleotide-binding universal stress UspA family protein
MTVVCGTDFSELSAAGARAAAALARRLGTDLHLVHALEPDADDEARYERARARLESAAEALRGEQPGVEVHGEVVEGPAYQAVADVASEHGAELVVVASRGRSSSPILRLGGTSERLPLISDRPVLVHRGGPAFEKWAAGERPLRILLGLDDSAAAEGAIGLVRRLREAGPCDVVVGRVYSVPEARERYGFHGLASWVEPDPEVERLIERDLSERLPELPGSGSLEYRAALGIGRQGDHLLHLAELERTDLVVLGSHRETGWGRLTSVAAVLLRFGHMAVATVPAPAGSGDETRADAEAPADLPLVRRVLAATDLSPFGDRAVRHAYGLVAGRPDAEVVLLHVAGEAPDDDQEAELAARLRERVPAAARGVATRTLILHGDGDAAEICAAAERLGADVVCIASHGRGGVVRAVLGSVAEAVVRGSRKPVLVVRPPER